MKIKEGKERKTTTYPTTLVQQRKYGVILRGSVLLLDTPVLI